MAKLKIYNEIVDEQDKIILSDWYGMDSICYKDITEFLESMDEDDKDIELLIHCQGGDCMEGWAIYDKLRTSGKNITATIEGMCASMATIILLAAPKERRFGFQNASLLIHDPAVRCLDDWSCERLTADEISRLKSKLSAQEAALIEMENKILNLYVDRTGAEREELSKLMKEDKFVSMDKAIELGFISGTVEPNTASVSSTHQKLHKMANKEEKVTVASKIINRLLVMAGIEKIEDVQVPLDQSITAVDGSVFVVEREEGDPQIGDKAHPDGSFTLEDGTVVTIENEVIKSIEKDTEDKATITQLTASLDEANKQIDALKTASAAALTEKNDLQKQIDSLKSEKDALAAEKAKADASIEALNAEKAELSAKIDGLNTELESLKADKANLEDAQKTDDEKSILDTVEKCGGKAWFDEVCKMKSTFNPSNRQFQAHGDNKGGEMSKTQKMLAELKAKQEEMRKNRGK